MAVYFAGGAFFIFYLLNIPLKFAFWFTAGETNGFGAGVSPFVSQVGWQSAQKRALGLKSRLPWRKFRADIDKIDGIRGGIRAAGHLIRHTKLEYLCVQGVIGTGRADITALACGALTSFARAAGAAAGAYCVCDIKPDFSKAMVSGRIVCIFGASSGQIMLAAVKGALEYNSGRLSKWIDTRLKAS